MEFLWDEELHITLQKIKSEPNDAKKRELIHAALDRLKAVGTPPKSPGCPALD